MPEELIPVNIVIGDRTYRIRVDTKDEETVRATVKLVNDKIVEFKTNFSGKDMQDYISMVLIWYATEQKKQDHNVLADAQAQTHLDEIEHLLSKVETAE
jgi:cell division protein ZapA (FtsZ GTPase activity inhibitor)